MNKPIPPPPARATFAPAGAVHVRPVSRPAPVLSSDEQRRFRELRANRKATARMSAASLMGVTNTSRVSSHMGSWSSRPWDLGA